jgi:hypothetical protein
VLVHVTAFSAWLSSLGGVWAVQVEPPFVVTSSVATLLLPPTAKHTVALGQLTSFSAVFVAGAVSEFQVDPPLVVEMIVGELPTRPPTATQCVLLAHETPWSAAVAAVGGVCLDQELPLAVAPISGAPLEVFPTSMQSLSSAQLISLYCPVALLGGVCVLHVGLLAPALEV